jgi:hypothetical protein
MRLETQAVNCPPKRGNSTDADEGWARENPSEAECATNNGGSTDREEN